MAIVVAYCTDPNEFVVHLFNCSMSVMGNGYCVCTFAIDLCFSANSVNKHRTLPLPQLQQYVNWCTTLQVGILLVKNVLLYDEMTPQSLGL